MVTKKGAGFKRNECINRPRFDDDDASEDDAN